jgi:DNA-binding transcriptional LysR family regulator
VEWSDLRHFLAVARSGTLAAAARDLGVEHTTVGRRIAALENALAVRLFTRGPNGFTLTAAGTTMLPSVEAIASHIESIERRIAGDDERVAGTVRLTIPESGNSYFVRRLEELRERHPDLLLEIVSDNRDLDIRRGEADIAVRFKDLTDPELVVRKVGLAGWSLYASKDYLARRGPLQSSTDIRGHDVVGFDGSLAEIEGAKWLRRHGEGANVVLRGNSIAAVTNAACFGLGLAALPCFSASQEEALVRLTPELIGTREFLLVVHPDLVKVGRVRAVMDYLLEITQRDAALWI